MITAIKNGCRALVGRPRLRVALQALVSLALITVLVHAARGTGVVDSLRTLRPETLALAAGLQAAACVLNSRRWQLLLANAGVREGLPRLTELYFVGSFFSLFLPTSAGGDAVRVYDLARRHGRLAGTLVATVQERMVGLASCMSLGLLTALYYLPRLPQPLRAPALLLQAGGTLVALVVLNPGPLLRVGRRFGVAPSTGALARVAARLRPLAEVPALGPLALLRLAALGMTSALLGIGMNYALARGLRLDVTFLALCLVVPLVWIVRLLPVSLNGIGVGEGAFVFLLGLFAVPKGQALALALVVLSLQSSVALTGGLLLLVRLVRVPKEASGGREPPVCPNRGLTPPARRSGLDIAEVPVALLAGGLATRLRPITTTIPKALVEVAGRPFIDHQLALLRRNGVRRVVLCLGHLGEQVQAHLGDGSALGMELRYSHDGDRLLGTGGALRRALPLLGEVFWVMYGDSYMDIDYRAVLADFAARDALGLMTVLHNNNSWDTSNVVFQNGRLLRYDKRARLPAMTHIDYGVALLRRAALERIPPDQPCDLADLYRDLVAEGQMAGYEVTQRFYEIGSPRGLEETRAYLTRDAA